MNGLISWLKAGATGAGSSNAKSPTPVSVAAPLPVDLRQSGGVAGAAVPTRFPGEYEPVAASQTDQALGATGAAGDYLHALIIVPASTSPGAVSIKDGSGSAITVFAGGANSLSNLAPIIVPIMDISTSGAWKVTTGTNVSVLANGDFT